jgi:hypothetical protein
MSRQSRRANLHFTATDRCQMGRFSPAPEMGRYNGAPEMGRYSPAPEMGRYNPAPEMGYELAPCAGLSHPAPVLVTA